MLNHYVEPENRISDKGKLELKRRSKKFDSKVLFSGSRSISAYEI
jgi:hypothetical protein